MEVVIRTFRCYRTDPCPSKQHFRVQLTAKTIPCRGFPIKPTVPWIPPGTWCCLTDTNYPAIPLPGTSGNARHFPASGAAAIERTPLLAVSPNFRLLTFFNHTVDDVDCVFVKPEGSPFLNRILSEINGPNSSSRFPLYSCCHGLLRENSNCAERRSCSRFNSISATYGLRRHHHSGHVQLQVSGEWNHLPLVQFGLAAFLETTDLPLSRPVASSRWVIQHRQQPSGCLRAKERKSCH